MDSILLSIIIGTRNHEEYIHDFLVSLKDACKDLDYEIIVVDSASTDRTPSLVKHMHQDVLLIQNDGKQGFAKSINSALTFARGNYIAIFTGDTLLQGNSIGVIISFLEYHQEAGAVGGTVVGPDNTIQWSSRCKDPILFLEAIRNTWGYYFPLPMRLILEPYKSYLYLKGKDPSKPLEVDWVSGCFLVIEKRVIEKVGTFDTRFFAYYEDTELGIRLRKFGYKNYYCPCKPAIHYHSKTSNSPGFNRYLTSLVSSYTYFKLTKGQRIAKMYKLSVSIMSIGAMPFFFLRFILWPNRQVTIQKMRLAFRNILWKHRGIN